MRRIRVELSLSVAGVTLGIGLIFLIALRQVDHPFAYVTWGYPWVWRFAASASPGYMDSFALYEDIAFWLTVALAFVEVPLRMAASLIHPNLRRSSAAERPVSIAEPKHSASRGAVVIAAAIIVAVLVLSTSILVAAGEQTTTLTVTTTSTYATTETITTSSTTSSSSIASTIAQTQSGASTSTSLGVVTVNGTASYSGDNLAGTLDVEYPYSSQSGNLTAAVTSASITLRCNDSFFVINADSRVIVNMTIIGNGDYVGMDGMRLQLTIDGDHDSMSVMPQDVVIYSVSINGTADQLSVEPLPP